MTTLTVATPQHAARIHSLGFVDLFLDAALTAAAHGITAVGIHVHKYHPDNPPTVSVHVGTIAEVNALADHYHAGAEHTQAEGIYLRSGHADLAGMPAHVEVFAARPQPTQAVA